MNASRTWVSVCAVVVGLVTAQAMAVEIETVPVGNAGNTGEWSGESYGGYGPDCICGSVDYSYNIGKYEVTAGQYTEFLNAVAGVDTYGLYITNMWSSDYGCKIERFAGSGTVNDPYQYRVEVDWALRPVNFVSWGDAARFANWLHNGQPTGAQDLSTTEDGAYYLNGATSDAALLAVNRESDWKWAITSEDEWYKAAYHKNDGVTGDYWDYPMGSSAVPDNGNPGGDTGNSANCYDGDYTIGSPYWRTEVGYFGLSDSPYGTFEQGGNVWEWNEAMIGSYRGMRGGSFCDRSEYLHASYRFYDTPTYEDTYIGFRVASAPEPAPPVVVAAESVKSHGTAGDLGSDMLLSGDGVECRTGGPTQLVVTFDQDVYGSGSLSDVWLSAGTVDGVTIAGNTVTVDLSGALNGTVLTVAFPGIENSTGQTYLETLCIRVLAGDVNGDGEVSIFDLVTVRDNTGQPVTEANCRSDANGDGEINIFDLVLVRDQTGTLVGLGGMVLIPAGEFEMGDTFNEGESGELPVHAVDIDAFYLDRYEVTKSLWDTVRSWATSNDYSDLIDGDGKAANHPVHSVNWYDCVKWSNARSEMDGRTPCYYTDSGLTTVYKTGEIAPYVNWDANGYRLPTEAEWEKAARGGASGHRFPWSDTDTIQHARANYYSSSSYAYDTSPTRGYHPDFDDGVYLYTSPVGHFAPNGYGLYDIAGNVYEYCNDRYSSTYYSSSPYNNPDGPTGGSYRVIRGGSWGNLACYCRVAFRGYDGPDYRRNIIGFRLVLDAE